MKILKNLLLLIVIATVLGCAEKERSVLSMRQGGMVRIALNSAIEDIFPLTTDETNVEQINRYMLSPSFVTFDTDGEAQPDLADAWQIDDDNKSVTFILNPKMTWSNGRSVTVKDVKFTLDLINSEHIGSYLKERTKLIENLEIIDSLTCRFNFSKPVSDPLYYTNISILPIELDSFRTNLNHLKNHYKNKFIGCGPFIVKSYISDSLVLDRNDYYKENYPIIERVIFKFIKSNEQLEKLIEEKKVDLVANLPLDFAANKKYLEFFNILTYPERGYTFIGWNLKNTLLKNKQLRMALTYAIDKQTIADGILGGYCTIVNGPIYQDKNFTETHLPKWSFNPVRAESLFNSLGWITSDKDGIRRKYGKKLSFNLMVNKENKERIDSAINIKANLRSVGVDLQLQFVTWKQILKNIRRKKIDAILLTWTDGDHYDPSQLFHSSAIANGLNFMSYSSSKADSLIEGALQSWDKKQKRYYWQQFQKQVSTDLPCSFLFTQNILVGCSKNIKNVITDRRGYLVNIKEWWLDRNSKTIQ